MLILDTITPIREGKIPLAPYHRGHLSLKSGTEVTACLLPAAPSAAMPQMSELIVSPILFNSWRYLALVTGVFEERPGIVHKLASAIKDTSLNILYEESAAIEGGLYHRCEMLVDAELQYARFDEHQSRDRLVLSSIERRLKAICLNELILDGTRPRLKVRRMEGLRNAWTRYSSVDPTKQRCVVARTSIEHGVLVVPDAISVLVDQAPPHRAILISDTKERLLRVLLPHGDMHFTYIRVGHNDSIGALAEITDALAKAFNAVLTLTRVKTQSRRNDVEVLLFSDEFSRAGDEETRRCIAETLLSSSGLAHLNIEVAYPQRAGTRGPGVHAPTPTASISWKMQRGSVPTEAEMFEKSTSEILRVRVEDYRRRLRVEKELGESSKLRGRLDAAKILLSLEDDDSLPAPKIFVSFDFSHLKLRDLVGQHLTDKGCEVADGHNPSEEQSFRDAIRRRIQSSTGFIAVWKMRDDNTFSPWLLWELGVAQAAGLPYCLFVHNGVKESPHLRINPEKHHVVFEDLEFENKFLERLPHFMREVNRFERDRLLAKRNVTGLEDDFWSAPEASLHLRST